MSAHKSNGYEGDISVTDAYSMLERDKSAVLVDVRTKAEWSYVGVPDLSAIDKETLGRRGVELLLEDAPAETEVRLPVHLIVRASTSVKKP